MKTSVNISISKTETKTISFSLDELCWMISILNGIAVSAMGKGECEALLDKLNALRSFAEGNER